eukprot:1158152-Pelagomonas_calceolata.AAC.4
MAHMGDFFITALIICLRPEGVFCFQQAEQQKTFKLSPTPRANVANLQLASHLQGDVWLSPEVRLLADVPGITHFVYDGSAYNSHSFKDRLSDVSKGPLAGNLARASPKRLKGAAKTQHSLNFAEIQLKEVMRVWRVVCQALRASESSCRALPCPQQPPFQKNPGSQGGSLVLPPGLPPSEVLPLILVARNCTLQLRNVTVVNASSLPACLSMGPGGSLMAREEDGVAMVMAAEDVSTALSETGGSGARSRRVSTGGSSVGGSGSSVNGAAAVEAPPKSFDMVVHAVGAEVHLVDAGHDAGANAFAGAGSGGSGGSSKGGQQLPRSQQQEQRDQAGLSRSRDASSPTLQQIGGVPLA